MNAAKLILPLAIVAVLGLVMYNVFTHDAKIEASGCPGHWHTSFQIFVNGEKVGFPKPPYGLSGETAGDKLPLKMHMHQGDNGNIMHFEPNTDRVCQSAEAGFSLLDVELGRTSIKIKDDTNFADSHRPVDAGTYSVDGNHTLRAFMNMAKTTRQEVNGNGYQVFDHYEGWQEVSMDKLLGYKQLPDFTKLLIVYGAPGEDVEAYKAAVPNPPLGQ